MGRRRAGNFVSSHLRTNKYDCFKELKGLRLRSGCAGILPLADDVLLASP